MKSGDRIGPYEISREIGSGGFGVVYLAEQQQPIRRRVALKVIKVGMDTDQVIARFEAERQAIAMMDHPSIATVLDAGATEAGRPYFVMEYVDGVPITHYCDQNKLTTRARLELFVSVCQAVQHAHLKGIIHRDLKPSNVLVTEIDGKPLAKVIDFGIAKATNRRLTERTVLTEASQFIGTPAYMSPEQAGFGGTDIDTRSDVYSLGVLLYELLTGSPPFDPSRLMYAGIGEIQRIIREEEPRKPSTRISTLGAEASEVASYRRADVDRLVRSLRGDLDWIIMRALEKERARRYETAGAFADDIRRHLRDETVSASPPSATYRLRKFVRRRRGFVIAASVVALAVALGAVGTGIGLIATRDANARLRDALDHAVAAEKRAKRSAARADREAAAARRQNRIATAVNTFLNDDLLSTVAPSTRRGEGKDVTMREVIDVAAERVRQSAGPGGRFEGTPEVSASVHSTVANVYRLLGETRKAIDHANRAAALATTRVSAKEHHRALGLLGVTYLEADQPEDARRIALRQLVELRRHLPDDDQSVILAMQHLADAAVSRGKLEQGRKLFKLGLAILRASGPPKSKDMRRREAALTSSIAVSLGHEDLAEEALPYFEEALRLFSALDGADHPNTMAIRNNIATVYQQLGDIDEARAVLEALLEDYIRIGGEEHPYTMTIAHNLASVRATQGEAPAALELMERILPVARKKRPGHQATISMRLLHARILRELRRFDDALAECEDVLAVSERTKQPSHILLMVIKEVAMSHYRLQDYDRAAALYRRAVEGERRAHGETHPTTIRSFLSLARCEERTGGLESAFGHAIEGATRAADCKQYTREDLIASSTADVVRIAKGLARRAVRSGQVESALALLGRAVAALPEGKARRDLERLRKRITARK